MKYFDHVNAGSFEEASLLIKDREKKMQPMAGGSDLVDIYKDNILPDQYPDTVVNLKSIPGFSGIEDKGDHLEIQAGTKLGAIASSKTVKKETPAVAEAAASVASPLIRNIGTIGGNLMQDVRCWYYRYPDAIGDELNCRRKGGGTCFAVNGENRYHSVFGGMLCGMESCANECPASTDIPGYMAALREGSWKKAADIIMRYNPMPALTSRVCPHNCQLKCSQATYGESVNIHAVERSLGDYIMEHKEEYYHAPSKNTGKKVAVIGAGPGGLTAAYYLRKAGNEVVVYDRMEEAGGVMMYGIPHYRLPKTLVREYTECLRDMGISFTMNTEIGKDQTIDQLVADYDKVYVGTGAWKQPVLGIVGETLTQFGLNFLVEVNTYLKKAIGNEVLVCGGGNVAMDVALTAVRLGAKKVHLICLEQRDEMPASKEEVENAILEGVEIDNGWGLSKVVTDENGKVTGLESMRCTSVRNKEGRFDPQYNRSDIRVFSSDYIILATGQRVDIEFLGDLKDQLKTSRGLIDADPETLKTHKDKIYAGGDAVTGPNLAIRAIRAGRDAARSMNRELGTWEESTFDHEKFLHFDPKGVDADVQNKLPLRPVKERTLIDEDTASYSQEAALAEASRCMNCGCYSVNPSDLAPTLIMLGADIVTTERTISAKELFTSTLRPTDVLHRGELIKTVLIPMTEADTHYDKKRVRDSIDFAIVSLASSFSVRGGVIEDAKLVFGGVAPIPYEMPEVETFLKGKTISREVAEKAGELAVEHAAPMSKNGYKLAFIKDVLREAILRES